MTLPVSGREQAQLIDWHQPFAQVLDYTRPPFARWFVGGETNLCHNAVDRHLAARGDQNALVYISTETGDESKLHLPPAARRSEPLARRCCRALGVGSGDRVLIYMPMIPEAVFAMLACARIGAIHSVVFGGFAAASLADAHRRRAAEGDDHRRRRHARAARPIPYKPLVDESIRLAKHPPEHVLIVNRGLDTE